MGKLPYDILFKYVFSRLGKRDPSVLFGPGVGEDAAVIALDDKAIVCHVDPITGAEENIGFLAVHIACNDVAVRGAEPRWVMPCILLPEQRHLELLDKITQQIDEAARELGVAVVAGHTETTVDLPRPIVVMAAIGVAPRDKIVPISGARPGDAVILTKGAGLEGTAILATDFSEELSRRGVPRDVIKRARSFIREISVVRDALTIRDIATAMHDPTEGGVLGGLTELAVASGVLIRVWESRIPLRPETRAVCEALGVDPLKLISSGALLATVPRDRADEALKRLRSRGIRAEVIGEVTEGRGVEVIRSDGTVEKYTEPQVTDELFRLLEQRILKF